MKQTLGQQMEHLKNEAKKRGLKIRKDEKLKETPYRAAHPRVQFKTGLKRKGLITYDPSVVKTKKKLVMDTRHEIIEYDKMGQLMRKGHNQNSAYKIAHKKANREQRNIESV
jgi:hypothetical protein